jgi:hypothetical protein
LMNEKPSELSGEINIPKVLIDSVKYRLGRFV